MSGAKNCPETPRQKMIGMMYLVLTAMLALNVSADILGGFALVGNSLRSSISATKVRNEKLYRDFKSANEDNPEKTQEWYDKALEVKNRADSLYNYIQDFKNHIIILADGKDAVNARVAAGELPEEHIGANDNLDVTGQYAIAEGNGIILKELIANYRDYAADLVEKDVDLSNAIKQSLATERGYNAHAKDSCDWEIAVFEMMPVGASITILTKLQNDVCVTEGQVIQYLMDRIDAGDMRVNKLEAYIIPKSDYVMRGGKYSAQIILAALDSTRRPEYYIEGQRINDQGLYEVAATNVGVRKFSGHIAYQDPETGKKATLPFSSSFTVGEPAVTISNTDLNIMYRGHENKFAISVPGIANEKIKVSVNGAQIQQKGGLWIIKPNASAKQVTISVMAELDGKMLSMGSKDYNVRPLPKPQPFLKLGDTEYDGNGGVPRNALISPQSQIVASYGPDGLLDLPFKVLSFKANINGMYTESAGSKFSKDQLNRIEKLKKGATVIITDIRAESPSGERLALSPLPLTMN